MRSLITTAAVAMAGMLFASSVMAAERTYFVSPKLFGPAYWTAAEKGVKQAEKDLGVEVIYNASTEADSAKQINLFQDMLNRHLDGIAVAPNDAAAMIPVIKRATDAGNRLTSGSTPAPGVLGVGPEMLIPPMGRPMRSRIGTPTQNTPITSSWLSIE